MTAPERDALRALSAGTPTRQGRPPRIMRALERCGYVVAAERKTVFGKRRCWAVTDAGRDALAPRASFLEAPR